MPETLWKLIINQIVGWSGCCCGIWFGGDRGAMLMVTGEIVPTSVNMFMN